MHSLIWSCRTKFVCLVYICLPLFNLHNFCTIFVLVTNKSFDIFVWFCLTSSNGHPSEFCKTFRKCLVKVLFSTYFYKPSITVQHIYLILGFNSLYLYIKFIVQKIIKIFIKILKTCNKYIQFILYQNKMHANIQNIHFIIQKSFTHAKNVYN